ncbi:WD40 repeat domain-containing protein [Streptomyces antarcticus]|uniref:WD40 repeat domain-containing protein n=1 Tax=Streptomyces antarcticus TaxID=2996458 RepID=UPI00226E2CA6|nr:MULTISPECIES: WD40 repeat domain-containing protein [unclassified Streptomyces]MCY0944822.1 WD40 repeat domain-containing protein [Streptomyces sp. H34-AA3]MCY0953210.1 WD40 repeat domain-containing protein [Streptomyces sp. H27-S2]MCZ4081145.1 WD40 repeat domain-containing protein [Streptomyces sp. H34-S5]
MGFWPTAPICLPKRVPYGHADPINKLELSPHGRTPASGSDDRTVRLWRVDGAGPPRG